MTASSRPSTEIDRIAEAYVDDVVRLSPLTATQVGIGGPPSGEIDDLSPEGFAEASQARKRTLRALDRSEPADDVDRVTLDAMRERLGVEEERHAAELDVMELNVISSPLQGVRDSFDLMPAQTADDWAVIAQRLANVPLALQQWHASLQQAAAKGGVAARRQIEACMQQARDFSCDDGFFTQLGGQGEKLELGSAAGDLRRGVAAARQGYADTAERLGSLLDAAPQQDAVGREVYELASRYFLGAVVDLEETYAWGQDELARVTEQMRQCAEQIVPHGTIDEAIAHLDASPQYRLVGTQALQEWMQLRADEAVTALAGTHFDIPEPAQRIECRIAPTTSGGIYYTGPSEDFSRPGRMWWAVPPTVTEFGTWRELTTVYHEGVPGHHLQIGQTVYRANLLNRWRRLLAWTSGHGEGWALYAERLMEELGFLQDPGNRMGWLDAASMRAARVVLDIGLHCGFTAPDEVGGGSWDYDKAWGFLTAHANMPEGYLRFELDRYLGWAGQAPSYKVGERLWLQLREEVATREGEAFDLAAFHRRALDIGGVGLDTLRTALLV